MKKAAPQYQQSSPSQGKYSTSGPLRPEVKATYLDMAQLAERLCSAPLKAQCTFTGKPNLQSAHSFIRAFEELREIVEHGSTGLRKARDEARGWFRAVNAQIERGALIVGSGR